MLGAGPGGYSAAFRAADLGKKVVLVERYPTLGGVCLNVGCIPSKALLHVAKVIDEAQDIGAHGIAFAAPKIDLDESARLEGKRRQTADRRPGGHGQAAQGDGRDRQRRLRLAQHAQVMAEDGSKKTVCFDKAIIAAGSEPVKLPFIPHDDRASSTRPARSNCDGVPKRLLVLGGGIIGLEMATVYHSLGSKVTVVEMLDGIMPGADKDIVALLGEAHREALRQNPAEDQDRRGRGQAGRLARRLSRPPTGPKPTTLRQVLVAVGRKPNGKLIDAEAAGVEVDERGFIAVDKQMRTNVPHIFAIGDVIGQPMLAHKAVHEGHVAAEVACGHKAAFDAKVIPSVAYTDPEVAWVGLTENEAKAQGHQIRQGECSPGRPRGRALSLGRDEGVTKLAVRRGDHRLIGCGIVGPDAGDLIAEAALAIEMGADAEDIGLTIHPHPTLSETIGMAAEDVRGHHHRPDRAEEEVRASSRIARAEEMPIMTA